MRLIHKILLSVFLSAGLAGNVPAVAEPVTTTDPLPVAEFKLANFKGKVVLVDFWASWCPPCRQSLPWLNAMQQRYGDQGLQVVMVNLDRDPAAAAKMAAGIDADIRQFLDPAGELATRYELEGMPSSFLYDRSGELVASHVGFLKSEASKREIGIQAVLEREGR